VAVLQQRLLLALALVLLLQWQ
jgi:hypothetical protein